MSCIGESLLNWAEVFGAKIKFSAFFLCHHRDAGFLSQEAKMLANLVAMTCSTTMGMKSYSKV
jgi:hypothetical protein